MAVMLAARDLGFGYPGRPVGRGLELSLAAGEVLCVLGPNGGGKTTLFRTLLGLLPAQQGSVLLEGRPLARLGRGEIAQRLGYVPQGQAPLFAYSVREIVLMGRTAHIALFATPRRADLRAADAALELLGIEALAGRAYGEISGGERQLAMIARALAQGARVLVLDEPTASLDFGNQVRVLRQIARLGREGYAVAFSTHHPDQAFLCANRALLLARGEARRSGVPREVITADNLRETYGVEVRVAELGGVRACVPLL